VVGVQRPELRPPTRVRAVSWTTMTVFDDARFGIAGDRQMAADDAPGPCGLARPVAREVRENNEHGRDRQHRDNDPARTGREAQHASVG